MTRFFSKILRQSVVLLVVVLSNGCQTCDRARDLCRPVRFACNDYDSKCQPSAEHNAVRESATTIESLRSKLVLSCGLQLQMHPISMRQVTPTFYGSCSIHVDRGGSAWTTTQTNVVSLNARNARIRRPFEKSVARS